MTNKRTTYNETIITIKQSLMNKYLLFAATAAMMLASCSNEVDFTQDDVQQKSDTPTPIQFGTYLGKVQNTRADYEKGPIDNSADQGLKNAKFGVFAYKTTSNYDNTTPTSDPSNIAPNFMYNQEITWSTDKWTYEPVKYWPNGIDAANGGANPSNTATSDNTDRLSFFAVAPFITTPTGTYAQATDGEKPSAIGTGTTNDDKVKKNDVTKGIIAMTTNEFTGNVWVKYLMPNANEKEAVDLLWGTNGKTSYNETDNENPTLSAIGDGYNMNLTKQIVGEKVKFLFKHALAKIGGNTETTTSATEPASNTCGYMIKLDVDGNNGDNQNSFLGSAFTSNKTLVTVESVDIKDGKSAYDASWGISGVTTSNLANSGWFNIETGSWDATTVTQGATYSITASKDNTDVNDETYSLNPNIKEGTIDVKSSTTASDNWSKTSVDNAYTGGATGVTEAPQPLFAKENVPGLMVIPGGTQTLYVRIKYHVRTLDANLSTKYTEVAQTITNQVNLSSLNPNKYYKIIMHIGLTSVKFEAVVSDWQLKSDSNIDEEGHETGGSTDNKASVWLPSNVVSYAVAENVEAAAANTTVEWNAELGTYQEFTQTGSNSVSSVSVSGGTATIILTANTTSSIKTTTATLKGTLGKIVVTITQAAKAIIIGDLIGGKVTVSGPTDLYLSSAVITVVDGDGTNYTHNASAASTTEYTYDNDSNPKTITIPTATGKTYTITVTQNDATASKDITVTP